MSKIATKQLLKSGIVEQKW